MRFTISGRVGCFVSGFLTALCIANAVAGAPLWLVLLIAAGAVANLFDIEEKHK